MAVGWGGVSASTSLALNGTWQVVQDPGNTADWEIALAPNQIAVCTFRYDVDATAPSELCRAACCPAADAGSDYDDAETAPFQATLPFEDSQGTDYATVTKTIVVEGVPSFIIRAKLFDPDGTDGGDDSAALVVEVNIGTLS